MNDFGNNRFQLGEARLESKLAYTGFLVLAALGLGTNLIFQLVRIGVSLERLAAHYRGGELPDAMVFAKSFGQLIEVSHFHAFTMAIVFLILAHLVLSCSVRAKTKHLLIGLALAGSLLNLAGPWLVRYVSSALAILQLFSWIISWVGYGGMVIIPLWEMWLRPFRGKPFKTGLGITL